MPQTDVKNTSRQEQQQITKETIPSSSFSYQQFEEDTIDLYEIWITLWKHKWLIFALTIVAALGSLVYSFSIPSIYTAETLLLPPKEKDFQTLNIHELQKQIIKENEINFLRHNLDSITVFNTFKKT